MERRVGSFKNEKDFRARSSRSLVILSWTKGIEIMSLIDFSSHIFPPTQWEMEAATNVGFTITMFRFTLAFLASIPVSIIFRHVPTVTGKRHSVFLFSSSFFL